MRAAVAAPLALALTCRPQVAAVENRIRAEMQALVVLALVAISILPAPLALPDRRLTIKEGLVVLHLSVVVAAVAHQVLLAQEWRQAVVAVAAARRR